MVILFSDIDGTVTNKYSHALEGTDIWINNLIYANIPVIFTSSKTFLEICELQNALKINQPFIFENGSAIAIPYDQIQYYNKTSGEKLQNNFLVKPLAPKDFKFQICTDYIKELYPAEFFTLTTGDPKLLLKTTGLSEIALRAAQARHFTETYFFTIPDPSLDLINNKLNSLNAIAVKGSRFITVSHQATSKGKAIHTFLSMLRQTENKITTISVGDGENDFSMFKETDRSYFLTNKADSVVEISNCILINPEGPKGFIKVCKEILEKTSSI